MNTSDMLNNLDPDINYDFFNQSSNMCNYFSINNYLTSLESRSNLSIINYNIRSFNRNFDSFFGTFSKECPPCVLNLTETRFSAENCVSIGGYNAHHVTRNRETPSGGVSIYVASNINSSKIESLSYVNNTIEVCTVKIDFNSSHLILIGVYRPHSDTISNFSDHLNIFLNSPLLSNKKCVLLGDLNICLLKPEQASIDFSNLMYSQHYLPLISKATRFSPVDTEVPSLLDHIWINSHSTIPQLCGIVELDITDHLPTFVNLVSNLDLPSKKMKITFRLQNQAQKDIFKFNLEQFNWNSLKSPDVDTYVQNFLDQINLIFCNSFPLKTKYISYEHFCNPWFNSELKHLIKIKSQYFQLLRLNLITVKDNNLFRNKVNSIVRKHKQKYRKELFLKYRGNLRKTWNLINITLSRNLKKNEIKQILSNDILYDDELNIANIFNNFFCTIGSSLDSEIPPSTQDPLSFINININSNFFLRPVIPNEILYHIRNLKNSKQNVSTVSVQSIKENSEFLSTVISDMVNQCFSLGKFPDSLRIALVLPLYKKGDKTNVSNYRPICILPTLSKIIEKCMKVRLLEHLQNNSIISPSQFGFQSGVSTQDAIIHLTEKIYQNFNNFTPTLNVYIDFSKAFDTVNRDILIRKLDRYGIRGIALNLFVSYLNGRKQAVKVGGTISEYREINLGIPQGSVLGPILYLLYINEAPNISSLFSTCIFADDTTLIFKNRNRSQIVDDCNEGLQQFYSWCSSNKLSINISKTSFLYFSNSASPNNLGDVAINGTHLEKRSSVDFLGVVMDDKLKFNLHVNKIAGKVSKNAGILYKLRPFLPADSLKSIYYSFVFCYLNYCPIIFGNVYESHLKPLNVAQKKCIRIISNESPLAHTAPLFARLKMLKFKDIYNFNLGTYMYKNLDKFSGFQTSHSYLTRTGRDRYVPSFQRLTLTRNQSIYFQVPKNWNSIPDDVKNAPSLSSFKNRYKAYLISHY